MASKRGNNGSIFKSSLRFRLIGLVVLAALPALALTLYTGVEQRRQAEAVVKQNAFQSVQFAAAKDELLIESTRSLIVSLAHSLNPEDEEFFGCGHLFSHLKEFHFPYYSAFYVADLEGNILCTIPGGETPEDLLGCEHYNELIVSDDFVVSKYHICRHSRKGVIAMGYPLLDQEFNRRGVVNVAIDLQWFGDFAQEADLPPGSTLIVFDKGGTILAHFPDPTFWIGEKIPDDSVENQILSIGKGTIRSKGVDGLERLYAFMPLSGTEESVFISVGIPTSYAYGGVNRAMLRNLGLTLLVTALLLVAAWVLGGLFIMRPIRELVKTTQKLAEGDLSVRPSTNAGQGEFGILVRSITDMAESLAQREEEQAAAQKAIREYAADLERSNRDLQDFANIASHDLQEPLRKIASFSDILTHRYSQNLDKNAQEYLNRIQASAQRLQEFILALMNFSRISTKTQPSEQVDLNEVVKAVMNDLELQLEQAGAEVNVQPLPIIYADPIQMHQLFLNLISNSLKFRNLEAKTRIDIYSEITHHPSKKTKVGKPVPECHRVFIADNGIGFDEKYLDKIFQPFQRLHRVDEYSGSGMGLAICRKILERHGGAITAKSAPGKGATFIITYPCHD
jgi:signal transduction histidine kinase